MEQYATSSLPDLHIGGWTTQGGPISYPQDYNWSSDKGETDINVPVITHNVIVNVKLIFTTVSLCI